MNHVIVFYSRGYITFLGCQGKYLRVQRIIAQDLIVGECIFLLFAWLLVWTQLWQRVQHAAMERNTL